MAGKSNRGKNRKGSQSAANSSEQTVSSHASLINHSGLSDANGKPAASEPTNTGNEVKELQNASTENLGQVEINMNVESQAKQDAINVTAEQKAKQGGFLNWLLVMYL